MKKIFIIFIVFILIFKFIIFYDNYKFEEEAKYSIGIQNLLNIKIIEQGATQAPPSDYIVFKVKNKEDLIPITNDYQKVFPNKEKINIKISKYLSHFDLEKSYYIKVFEHRKKFREALIQEDIVIYVLTYSN